MNGVGRKRRIGYDALVRAIFVGRGAMLSWAHFACDFALSLFSWSVWVSLYLQRHWVQGLQQGDLAHHLYFILLTFCISRTCMLCVSGDVGISYLLACDGWMDTTTTT